MVACTLLGRQALLPFHIQADIVWVAPKALHVLLGQLWTLCLHVRH